MSLPSFTRRVVTMIALMIENEVTGNATTRLHVDVVMDFISNEEMEVSVRYDLSY